MTTQIFDAASHVMYVVTYDDVTFAVEGEPDEDHFTITYDNDTVTGSEGAKGDVQFSQRVASMATLTKTLQWGSDTNKVFNQVFKDQQSGNYPKRVELKRINDNENVLVLTCARALIQKPADYTIGTAASSRGWSWKLEKTSFPEVQAPA